MEQYKPLKGVKVVELSLMVASASCGRMMADWGADVIKLENTKGGDNFRKWPLSIGAPADDDFDPIFDNLNANKRAVSIDTRTKEGQEIVYRLLEDADVFLTNLRTEALRKQGLDYDTLKENKSEEVLEVKDVKEKTLLDDYDIQEIEAPKNHKTSIKKETNTKYEKISLEDILKDDNF